MNSRPGSFPGKGTREYPVVRLAELGRALPVQQHFGQSRIEWHARSRVCSLYVAYDRVDDTSPHPHRFHGILADVHEFPAHGAIEEHRVCRLLTRASNTTLIRR